MLIHDFYLCVCRERERKRKSGLNKHYFSLPLTWNSTQFQKKHDKHFNQNTNTRLIGVCRQREREGERERERGINKLSCLSSAWTWNSTQFQQKTDVEDWNQKPDLCMLGPWGAY